jgi:ribosomal protein S18 acetylase RimI-like enzyme
MISANSDSNESAAWHLQPFDSEHLGAPVAKLSTDAIQIPAALAQQLPEMIDEWQLSDIWLTSCRISANQKSDAKVLEHFGFRLIETLVTFCRPLQPHLPQTTPVTIAKPTDVEPCVRIGEVAFSFDRYHADPLIDDQGADRLKSAWVKNSLTGRADAALVVQTDGETCGFVLCLKDRTEAIIDLIAVAPEMHGRGHGKALVAGVLAHYAGTALTVRVATQADNAASIALYESCGFQESSRSLTYHWINGACS